MGYGGGGGGSGGGGGGGSEGFSSSEYPSLDSPIAGAFRFNTDSSQLEIYDGNQWTGVLATSPNQHTGGTRGLWAGGYAPGKINEIQYVNVDTTGNAIDFGDLTTTYGIFKGTASRTRGLFAGGRVKDDEIEYVTIASTGNSIDFGNLTAGKEDVSGASNGVRGLFMGGGDHPGPANVFNEIDYVTIAELGNAVDFGDLITARRHHAGFSSHTRGFVAAGWGSPANLDSIEYVNIATLGNAADFGDTVSSQYGSSGYSNAVRAVIYMGSNPSSGNVNTLCYITMSSLGNALDFGDVSANHYGTDGISSPTRGVIGGGDPAVATIEYFQIMTTGDAIDFGDLNTGTKHAACCSNGHGGL